MKIAVTYDNTNGMVFQHFGHTENFKMYNIEDGKITASAVVPTLGSGHGALADFLKFNSADILICGGIGDGAKNALAKAGIKLYGGVSCKADDAVQAFLDGTLAFNPDITCSHHDHEHQDGHSCGNHTCGSHTCG